MLLSTLALAAKSAPINLSLLKLLNFEMLLLWVAVKTYMEYDRDLENWKLYRENKQELVIHIPSSVRLKVCEIKLVQSSVKANC